MTPFHLRPKTSIFLPYFLRFRYPHQELASDCPPIFPSSSSSFELLFWTPPLSPCKVISAWNSRNIWASGRFSPVSLVSIYLDVQAMHVFTCSSENSQLVARSLSQIRSTTPLKFQSLYCAELVNQNQVKWTFPSLEQHKFCYLQITVHSQSSPGFTARYLRYSSGRISVSKDTAFLRFSHDVSKVRLRHVAATMPRWLNIMAKCSAGRCAMWESGVLRPSDDQS